MMTIYPLTFVEFKTWLESKKEDAIVGRIKDGNRCPIARALKENNRLRLVFVDDIDTQISYERIINPLWVHYFTRGVDSNWQTEKVVTAKKALEVLNNLYICTVCNQYNPEGTNCGKKDNCPW